MSTRWYAHFLDVPVSEWRWPNFTPGEMADSRSGQLLLVPAYMDWLQLVRKHYGRPMIISSGFRTPEHQQTLPGHRTSGSHVHGMAVDVRVYGSHALELVKMACENDVMGLGIHQDDENVRSRYIHLDMWDKGPEGVRPNIWSY